MKFQVKSETTPQAAIDAAYRMVDEATLTLHDKQADMKRLQRSAKKKGRNDLALRYGAVLALCNDLIPLMHEAGGALHSVASDALREEVNKDLPW